MLVFVVFFFAGRGGGRRRGEGSRLIDRWRFGSFKICIVQSSKELID